MEVKMNIGIDIDGVLTNYRKFTIEQGKRYCEENKKGKLVNSNGYDSTDIFDWDEKTDLDFWIKNIFLYAKENPVIEGASENIKRLKDDGHTIYIITARWLASPETDKNFSYQNDIREKMRKTIKEWLAKNNIIYDYIIFSEEDKSKYILENNIDIMIEDSPNNLKNLSKLTKMICVDWPYNKDVKSDNIYRCYNWNEIYDKIFEISKI